MEVLQLVGNKAGQTVEMPFAVARGCVEAGTARWPDGERAKVVAPIKARPNWRSMKFLALRWLLKREHGLWPANMAEARVLAEKHFGA